MKMPLKKVKTIGDSRDENGDSNTQENPTENAFTWLYQSKYIDNPSGTKCSKEDPILIVLDNHESHISLETILFCRENEIIFATFFPLCMAYRPFKDYLKVAFNYWHASNPGKRISIYEAAELTGKAYSKAFTIETICSGFKKRGTVPFDGSVFTAADFSAALISNSMPSASQGGTQSVQKSEDISNGLIGTLTN
ncbi:hypothetical protein ILUMI_16800 [Ignelater luminosus]|uniref:DDE-1 domain-containing protein n=1 Tax=Ignelater luminosus TaxID=2038154 RepID=A0A8K0CL29_IGNLU|nr:hypothetical protein ILUMI_16800 [Ignelater luminosus]